MDTRNKILEVTILSELEKLIRFFSFYPAGHNYLKVASNRIFNNIRQAFVTQKDVIYTIDRKHIFLNDNPLDGFDKLAKLLFYKRIKTLTIRSTVKLEEFLIFVNELLNGELILPREKSIREALFRNNVSGIEVEELDYETIREAIDNDTNQQLDSSEEEIKLENVIQDLTTDEQEAIKLINIIEKEHDPRRYEELSNSLVVLTNRLVEIERYEVPLIAIQMYTKHVYQRENEKDIVSLAKDMVNTISSGGNIINRVIEPIVMGNPYYYDLSIRTIKIIGDRALKELTMTMIKTENLQSIKFMASAFLTFQKQAYPYLKEIIVSDNYKSAISAIETTTRIKSGAEQVLAFGLTHKDMRIRKRALQALFELNTPQANSLIEQVINSKDQRMVAIVIEMIGKYRREIFISKIKHILATPSIPYSLKQDVILTLGELGNKEATHIIVENVFNPSAPLAGQYPEIRLVGIRALGIAMNENAIANLVKLLESKDEGIRLAVWNTLNDIRKKLNV
ncbi:MAG: HEAT repeat domain-containing protein [bacterium]